MFGLFENLVKATVGVVIETPLAVVADVVTLGGTLSNKDEPYTAAALSKVVANIEQATR
jgi:hypothetical protein